jgi:DNA segregation ATPase FtsK/SpoIIIE, S-DNA-T family
MELLVELISSSGIGRDLVIEAADDVTVGQLASHLAEGGHGAVYAHPTIEVLGRHSERIEVTTPLALADLVSGDRIRLCEAPPSTSGGAVHRFAGRSARATLVIASGPERGRRIDLTPGSHLLGRGGGSTIVIGDPLMSREHARVSVADVVTIADNGSTNGVLVEGAAIVRPVVLEPGVEVLIGDTALRAEMHGQAPDAASAGRVASVPRGRIEFNRPPRVWRPFAGEEIELPAAPASPGKQRLPMIAALAPFLLGIGLFAVTRNIASVLFVALSPVMVVGSYVESKRSGSKDFAALAGEFRGELSAISSRLDALAVDEHRERHIELPPVADLAEMVLARTPRLWERAPGDRDFLRLRIGTSDLPSRTTVTTQRQDGDRTLRAEAAAVPPAYAVVTDVPVPVDLAETTSVGIAGPRDIATATARSLVLQAVCLHSPADLAVVALVGEGALPAWTWLRWLPHTTPGPFAVPPLAATPEAAVALLGALSSLAAARRPGPGSADKPEAHSHLLVVVDESVPVERSRLTWLLEVDPSVAISVVWVASSVARLPKGCGTVVDIVDVTTRQSRVGSTGSGELVRQVRVEGIPVEHAERVSRAVAPIVDVGSAGASHADLPPAVSLVDAIGEQEVLTDSTRVSERWRQSRQARGLRATIGIGPDGPLAVDLRADGPHALVAGTTGAGKSELLQTLIASLALNHSPAAVTFLLVDYKGGAAFKGCEDLAHTVGFVTDLDAHEVRRALVSLDAELEHRERILGRANAKDIDAMEEQDHRETPPRLVIVVDEFAALRKEIPEFVDGMVNIAQRGRSLGLHMVLATQRPAGAITDDIRANTALRMALRVADESESSDVIDTGIAASISKATPGRAYVKLGATELLPFQCGYVGGRTAGRQTTASIRVFDLGFGSRTAWHSGAKAGGHASSDVAAEQTDLQRIVQTVAAAAETDQFAPPRRPWLAPLPTCIDLFALPRAVHDDEIPIAVVDDPEHQRQRTAYFSPEREGSLLVLGTSGSGKTATLRSIAASLASALNEPPVEVYALDFAGRGLSTLESLPNVGSVISGDDHERVTRLLGMLRTEIVRRTEILGARSLGEARAAGRPGAALPRIVVLLDGYGQFAEIYERIERGVWLDVVPRLIGDGRAVGIHVVLTAERRGAVPMSVWGTVQSKIVLRLANPDEYSSAGVAANLLSASSPPGRAIHDDLEAQIVVPGGTARADDQAKAIARLGRQLERQRHGWRAPAIGTLGERIGMADLPVGRSPEAVPIGVESSTLAVAMLDASGGLVLIGGHRRSGKSTALGTVSLSAARASGAEPWLIGHRRSPLAGAGWWKRSAIETAEINSLLDELAAAASPVVLAIDDAHELDSMVDEQLTAMLRTIDERRVMVVAAVDTTVARKAWQGVAVELRKGRTGLLLQPEVDSDGDLLNVALPRLHMRSWPEGRGFLVQRGRADLVQVAVPA